MKILLKILVAPFVLALSLLAVLVVFLFDICAFLLTIASVILAVLGIALFFTPTPIGGIVFLFLAFLLSPYGCKRRRALCFGHWTEENPLCIGFWQVNFGSACPKQERVASSHPFLLYSISTYEKDCGASVIL